MYIMYMHMCVYVWQDEGFTTDIGIDLILTPRIVVYWTLMSTIAVFTLQALSMLLQSRKSLLLKGLYVYIIHL